MSLPVSTELCEDAKAPELSALEDSLKTDDEKRTFASKALCFQAVTKGEGGEDVVAGKIAGSVDHNGCNVNRLMVEESFRKTKGVGSCLMHHFLAQAKELGATQTATVETFNHQGPLYYSSPKLGFTRIWERPGWGAAGAFIHFSRSMADVSSEGKTSSSNSEEMRFEAIPASKEMDLWFRERFQKHHFASIGAGSNSLYWAIAASIGEGKEKKTVALAKGKNFFGGCVISTFIVDPHYRGKGVGKTLLKAVEDHARTTLKSTMLLADVFEDQNPTFFLEFEGWKQEYRLEGFSTAEGKPCALIYLRKDLE